VRLHARRTDISEPARRQWVLDPILPAHLASPPAADRRWSATMKDMARPAEATPLMLDRGREVTTVTSPPAPATHARSYIPLFWRLFVPNAVVLGAACAVLMIQPANGRVFALVGGLVTLLVVNVVLMRRAFAPLAHLTSLMARVDPLRPGERIAVPGPASEVTVLADTFNAMLDRLELERRESGRRTLSAQEDERRNVAAELHDEIGQTVTALVLQLDRIAERSEDPVRQDATDARDTAVALVEEIRALARRLRPEALDALGLPSALRNLVDRLSAQTGLPIERAIAPSLPALTPEAELVIYRVAQESLTNILRHAGATRASVSLTSDAEGVLLVIDDDGRGFDVERAAHGGIRNMRERSLLVGGRLAIGPRPGGRGTQVRLLVGQDEQRRDDDAAERPAAAR
jgi:two-component system sensor histidine kinase UhpB